MISVLTSLYVVANLIPISVFVGGAGFITAGVILLPVIAKLLKPKEAVVVAAIASLILFLLQLSIMPIYGFYGLIIPVAGILFGSLGAHKSYLYPAVYIVFGAVFYLLLSGGIFLWVFPYLVAASLSIAYEIIPNRRDNRAIEFLVHSLDSTICELSTMTIGSIAILHIPAQLWIVILPAMLFERSVAVLGSVSLLGALGKVRIRL